MPRCPGPTPNLGRRDFFSTMAGGLGGIALAQLLGESGVLADTLAGPLPDLNGGLHHRAKARRVIQLFMNGGASQMDLFDFKPELVKRHGETFDPGSSAHVIEKPERRTRIDRARFPESCSTSYHSCLIAFIYSGFWTPPPTRLVV